MGVFVHSSSYRLETTIPWLSLACLLHSHRINVMKTQRKSSRFSIDDGLLFRRGYNQAPLRCITSDEVARVLKIFMQEIVKSINGTLDYSNRLFILVIIGP